MSRMHNGLLPPTEPKGVATTLDAVFRQLMVFVVLLGLALTCVLAFLVGSIRPDQARYRSAARALELAHAAMLDQETGLRGYLLVADATFQKPYRDGVDITRAQNAVLSRTLGSDRRLAPYLLRMRLAEQAWTSGWASAAAAGRGPTDSAARAAFLESGKDLFDRYRGTEVALRTELWKRRDSLYAREGSLLVAGLSLTVLLGGMLMTVVLRQRRVLRRTVVAPVRDILTATRAVGRGDLTPELTPAGPEEFQQIAHSINEMRAGLARVEEDRRIAQARVEAQADQLNTILVMSREIAGSLNLRYVLRTVGDAATTVSGFDRAVIWLAEEDAPNSFGRVFDSDRPERSPDGGPGDARVELGVGVVGQAVRYGRTATSSENGEPSVEVNHDQPLRSIAVPLVVGARVVGAVELVAATPHRMGDGTLDVLETLATHAAAAIEAARLHTGTEALAHTDALTGLSNRRRLDHELALECERSARYGRPLALIMFDVDHFKRLNDTHGHQRGDEVLQQLTAVVREEVRTTDTVYRYGGEEFVVLARETDLEDATQLAERLRARVEEHFLSHGAPSAVTASFGVAVVSPEDAAPKSLIETADAALYDAKASGRNRVSVRGGVG